LNSTKDKHISPTTDQFMTETKNALEFEHMILVRVGMLPHY